MATTTTTTFFFLFEVLVAVIVTIIVYETAVQPYLQLCLLFRYLHMEWYGTKCMLLERMCVHSNVSSNFINYFNL